MAVLLDCFLTARSEKAKNQQVCRELSNFTLEKFWAVLHSNLSKLFHDLSHYTAHKAYMCILDCVGCFEMLALPNLDLCFGASSSHPWVYCTSNQLKTVITRKDFQQELLLMDLSTRNTFRNALDPLLESLSRDYIDDADLTRRLKTLFQANVWQISSALTCYSIRPKLLRYVETWI